MFIISIPTASNYEIMSSSHLPLNTQNNMVKMVEVQEDRFGRTKGSVRRRTSLQDEESLYTETEKDGELVPYGTHSGLLENKGIQDRLVSEYAAKHADLVAKHEAEQARITTDLVAKHEAEAEQSNSHAEQARITVDYDADVGVLSDGDSQPYDPKTSGALDPTMSEEPSYLTEQMDSMTAHTVGHSSEKVSMLDIDYMFCLS